MTTLLRTRPSIAVRGLMTGLLQLTAMASVADARRGDWMVGEETLTCRRRRASSRALARPAAAAAAAAAEEALSKAEGLWLPRAARALLAWCARELVLSPDCCCVPGMAPAPAPPAPGMPLPLTMPADGLCGRTAGVEAWRGCWDGVKVSGRSPRLKVAGAPLP